MDSRQKQPRKADSRLLECVTSNKPLTEKLMDIRRCLEQRADVNTRDECGRTPLHLAVLRGKVAVIKLLLKRGADVNTCDNKDGRTPLHEAVISRKIFTIQMLLTNGADVNTLNVNYRTPLYEAVYYNMIHVVQLLLDYGAKIDPGLQTTFLSPLSEAVRSRNMFILNILIDNDYNNINSRTINGDTLLHQAVMSESLPIVMFLLDKGINIEAKNKYGNTPLHDAVKSGSHPIVELLLCEGADINATNKHGDTPLHEAVYSGSRPIVELLENFGADIKATNIYGKKPFDYAISSGLLTSVNEDDDLYMIHAVMPETMHKIKHLFNKHDYNDYINKMHIKLLKDAVMSGSLPDVEHWLEKCSLDFQYKDLCSVLHMAMRSESLPIMKLLFDKGVNINAQYDNLSELLYELAFKSLPIVKLLLANSTNIINSKTLNGKSLLHMVVSTGSESVVKLLLDGGSDFNLQDVYGNAPLHEAVHSQSLSIIKMLLSRGANIDSQNKRGETPVLLAAKKADSGSDIVNLLINEGADINLQCEYGYTPLHNIASIGLVSVLELLLNKGANINSIDKNGRTPLFVAICNRNMSIVNILINKGANINVEDKDGTSLLHIAVRSGSQSLIKLLISKGIDIDLQCSNCSLLLHEAAQRGFVSVLELLLSAGANINSVTEEGCTPLFVAMYFGKISVVKMLIKKGADVNVQDEMGTSLLHLAVRSGSKSEVELLLNNGIDINLQCKDGCTALHEAARAGVNLDFERLGDEYRLKNSEDIFKDIVKLLLNKNADVNVQDKNGNTPLHEASKFGATHIVKLLIYYGADVNVQDRDGNTPLHEAVRNGTTSIVKLLLKNSPKISSKISVQQVVCQESATQQVRPGADIHIRNNMGNTAYTYALLLSYKGNENIVTLFENAMSKSSNKTAFIKCHSQNPQDNFQCIDQATVSKDCQVNRQCTYLKSNDSSGLPGQLYETKMLSLVLIRLLNHDQIEHDILIGTNIGNIDAMDDICLRYRVKKQGKPVVLFIQAKHKENPARVKVTDESLWNESSDFDLTKYFKSYLKIKNRFFVDDKDLMFKGEFNDVDSYFIIYTTANEIVKKKKTANKIDTLVHYFINTGKNTEPFQYKYSKTDIDNLISATSTKGNPEEEIEDFFNRLWFYCSQAKEDKVESIVKNEINNHYNNDQNADCLKFETHADAIYLRAHGDIQKWWMLKGEAPYLTRSDDFYLHAKLACFYHVLLTACKAINQLNISVDLGVKQQFSKKCTSIKIPTIFEIRLSDLLKIINRQNESITVEEFAKTVLADYPLSVQNYLLNSIGASFPNILKNNNQITVLSNEQNNDFMEYSKRTGTSGVGGVLFKIKTLCLILLRVRNHNQIENSLLATKIQNIGVISDICLRYEMNGQAVVIFIHLVHKDDIEQNKLTDESLESDSGDFSLRKYFKSYLMIKNQFQVGKENPMFEGEFSSTDCHFILYTTAKDSLSYMKSDSKLSKVVQDLISTGHNSRPFQCFQEDAVDTVTRETVIKDEIENLGKYFLQNCRPNKNNQNLLSERLILRYHVAMRREVLQKCDKDDNLWQFRPDFIDSEFPCLVTLRDAFVKILFPPKKKDKDKCQPLIISNVKRNEMLSLKFKLPTQFGNLDMTLREGGRIKTLANELINLFKRNNKTKIVHINHDNVGPGKEIQKGFVSLNGGIGSAVGNILVLDTDSNMLKLDLENKSLPHNADLFLKELQDMNNKDLSDYRIQIQINNFPKYSFHADEYDKILATEFLSKFWFYPNQSKEDELEQILQDEINKKNSETRLHNHITVRNVSNLVIYKIEKWWMQTNESPYLSRASELFEKAEQAEICNLLQTVINFMYVTHIYSIDIKVKPEKIIYSQDAIHRDCTSRLSQHPQHIKTRKLFSKIFDKLFNLFDSQCDTKHLSRVFVPDANIVLSLKIHPELEWVALTLRESVANTRRYFIAKSSPCCSNRDAKNRVSLYQIHVKDNIIHYENTDYFQSSNYYFHNDDQVVYEIVRTNIKGSDRKLLATNNTKNIIYVNTDCESDYSDYYYSDDDIYFF